MNVILHELYSTKYWCILPESVSAFRKALAENIASHRAFSHNGMPGSFLSRSNNFEPSASQYVTTDPKFDIENPYYGYIKDDDEFINLVRVTGGITRNNGCGYGSKAHRDQVLYATKRENCIGHIFLIDTPGGSVLSIEDYTEAINAAKAAGQPVIACIDGLCASAGYALACQCDEIYYTADSNVVGCVGCLAIYTTQKNGDVNSITQETYHEIYDPESFDKNIDSRKSAEGDDSLILERLAECGRQFRELVMKCRPNVKDEQLHGNNYKASEVVGTLVDGKLDLDGCISRLSNKEIQAPAPVSDLSPSEEEEGKCAPKKKCETTTNVADASPSATQTQDNMITENIQTALVEAQASLSAKEEELANVQTSLAEKEQALADKEAELATANENLEKAQAELDKANADLASANEEHATAIAEKQTEIDGINASLIEQTKAIEEKDATIANLNADITKANETNADLQAQLDKANADLAELSAVPSSAVTPAPATAGNGEGDAGIEKPEYATASRPGMTIEERRAAQKARDKELGLF